MADLVSKNPRLFFAGYDLSGDLSSCAIRAGSVAVDDTKFGNGGIEVYTPGLARVELQYEGWVQYGTNLSDDALLAKIGSTDQPVMVLPATGTDAEVGYICRSMVADYSPFGAKVGEGHRFSLGLTPTAGSMRRGTIMHDTATARTASGNGTARQLGSLSATQKMYAQLQVVAASGTTPTLDVVIQSDDAAGMSSPTSRITFTQRTALGQSEWKELSGAVTDDYWRVNYTIGGTSPSFTFAVVLAIA